jgi:UDP-N-acetylmuramoyl-tripeptide--D-alanyl-D-alanine ligase
MPFHAILDQITTVLQATPVELVPTAMAQVAHQINTDTRTLQPGQLFLALRGESFDGHGFVSQAIAAGAIAAVVDQPTPGAGPQLVVKDTLAAYQRLGQWWRQQCGVPIIAITGSVGKTTTKELIAAVLATAGPVLKTQANFNNEIGVPKTLLELSPDHRFAVVEMGMRGRGEIACLAEIAQPDVAVITNVGTAHIGRLGSREAIAEAKCELLATLPADHLAVLNAENPLLLATADRVRTGQTITYGLNAGAFRGTLGPNQTLVVAGESFPLPLPGDHNALNYLAAIAIALHFQLSLEPIRQGITVQLPEGRAQQYPLPNDVLLLDESYNAGRESMEAALRLLAQTPGTRHIAVLGPMKELGDQSLGLHREVGELAASLGLDQVLILDQGEEGTAIAQGAKPLVSEQWAEHKRLGGRLLEILQPGDRVLFKASHSVGLDQIVAQIREHFSSRG